MEATKEQVINQDEAILHQLGYKQVLYRSWGAFTAITITISAMSVLTSISASFGTGLAYGGPVVCIWGWIVVSFCMLCVALGMAELASAYPTSGGMYYWQYKLAGPRVGPFACWITGWLNLLGQIAAVSAVSFLLSGLIGTMVAMASSMKEQEPLVFTPAQVPSNIVTNSPSSVDLNVLYAVAAQDRCTLLTLCSGLGACYSSHGSSSCPAVSLTALSCNNPSLEVSSWFDSTSPPSSL